MTTTLGQLIVDLFDAYEQRSCDPELAALATAAIVNDLLCDSARRDTPARSASPRAESAHHAHV